MPVDDSPMGISARRAGALIAAAALFFALTSPFNAVTYLAFPARLVYWAGLISITAGTHWLVWRVARGKYSRWALAVIVSLLATPLVLAAILSVQQMISRPVALEFWWSLSASVWVINAALATFAAYLSYPLNAVISNAEITEKDLVAGIRQRLPESARDADIWALSAQDHYLDVILAEEQHLIHMRFGDAVAMMALQDGLQVHRSWWVARDAIERINRKGRQVEILLRNGQRVPVSRAGTSRLRDAGWLS